MAARGVAVETLEPECPPAYQGVLEALGRVQHPTCSETGAALPQSKTSRVPSSCSTERLVCGDTADERSGRRRSDLFMQALAGCAAMVRVLVLVLVLVLF